MSNAEETQLVEVDETLPEIQNNNTTMTPVNMVEMAVQQGADLEKLDKLMQLEERWEKNNARKAYHAAVANFKRNPPKVIKDKVNKQYDSRYASKHSLVNTVNAELGKHGLNARWDINQNDDDLITVSCILTHELGHSESVTMKAPPDSSGSKNPIQQIKSTKTYLEIATFESVTGVAASDEGDDDGNGFGVETINDEQVADLESLISEVGANKAQFLKVLKIDDLGQLPANKYNGAVMRLEQKRKQ
ncbi:MAG: single-stranded DNA-binding protein [gamma proteobacterium symbiont of Ctena orbiculata]|nr:MAG: single-stranded DNA-binding protein [gamma proteobacterium symbiont of Ctena orbiculata]